jgi:quercetin dioxygenase-like cupin family protein
MMADSLNGGVPEGTLHLRRNDQVTVYGRLPGSDQEGTRRGVANGVLASACMVNLITMPPAQRGPERSFNAEHVAYQVTGTTTWVVEGERFTIEPGDLLFIPADRRYWIMNEGAEEGSFLDIAASAGVWPPTISYTDGAVVNAES